MSRPFISFMVFLPCLGALAQVFWPQKAKKRYPSHPYWVAFGASLASALTGIILLSTLQSGEASLQAVEWAPWIDAFSISYSMGVDGLNALLVLLISIVFPVLISMSKPEAPRGIQGLLLLLQGSLLGAVCAQDFFLLFFFWVASAFPFYFLIGIWGGQGRERAAFRYITTSAISNALLFIALILVYYSSSPHSFSFKELQTQGLTQKFFSWGGTEFPLPSVLLLCLGVSMSLRIPIWPLHGWFSDYAEESPTVAFAALSATLVPVGVGIFFRLLFTLLPGAIPGFSGGILLVGILNLVAGALSAATEKNLRRLWSFLCVSELGLILIGFGTLDQASLAGATYQLLVFGLGLAGFGLFCEALMSRTGSPLFLDEKGVPLFTGLASLAPRLALLAAFLIGAWLGLPLSGGFIGHSLILMGGFPLHLVSVLSAGFAFLVLTYCLFNLYQHLFLGEAKKTTSTFQDLTPQESACLVPLVVSLLFLGLYPKPFLNWVQPTLQAFLETLR